MDYTSASGIASGVTRFVTLSPTKTPSVQAKQRMPLAQLPTSTVRLIGSTQVITSVTSVVKELMENSIDSGAQNIEIKLDKHGLEKIEVKDDGCGIGKSDAMVLCLPNYTSKISSFSDLDILSSYGFRGEALSSLCNVAQVFVTTKTADEEIATCYTYDHSGQVTCSKISHITKGTIVTVTNLFKNLPVRKQFMSSSKRAADELKKVEKIVKSLAMIHPRLRVTLIHNKFMIWQKSSVANLRQAVMQVISLSIVKQLHHILHNTQQIRVEMLVPKCDCDVSSLCFSNFSDAYFLFINNRPVRHKEIEKTVYSKLFEYFGVYMPVNKHPVCITCLTLPPEYIDVNLEPNKTLVLLKNQEEVLDILKQCLFLYYGDQKKEIEDDKLSTSKPSKKRKVEGEFLEINSQEECKADKNAELNKVGKLSDHNTESSASSGSSQDGIKSIVINGNRFAKKQLSNCLPSCTGDSIPVYGECLSQQDMDDVLDKFCLERDAKLAAAEKNICISSNKEITDSQVNTNFASERGSTLKKIDDTFENFCLERGKKLKEECIHPSNEKECSNNQMDTNCEEACNTVHSPFFNADKSQPFPVEHSKEVKNCSLTNDQSDPQPEVRGEMYDMLGLMRKGIGEMANKRVTVESGSYLSIANSNKSSDDISRHNKMNSSNSDEEEVLITFEKEKTFSECNNSKHDVNVDTSSPTLSQWSRGEVTNSSGIPIKGSCVLTNTSGISSPQTSQSLSNRSVSSQMGCKEMSNFTKFARSMRKKLLEEQPDMSFTKVAQQLQVQWRQLDEEEKKKYEDTKPTKKVSNLTSTEKQKTQSLLTSVLLKKKPHIEIEINIESLKQMVKCSTEKAQDEVRLIGQLESSPIWLYCDCGLDLTVFSVPRLLEAVKFHKYLDNCAVPVKLLDHYIPFSQSDIGICEWNLLLTLERSPNGVVKDPRLVSNGFLVEICEGELEARITYVPHNISYCGLEELQEVLGLLQSHGPQASLSQCRPLKVISFIRSEVMRECGNEEPPTNPEHVTELLSYWLNRVSHLSQSCIHHHPVTQSLDII